MAQRIKQHVLTSILSLQFEDISIQNIDHVNKRIATIEDLMQAVVVSSNTEVRLLLEKAQQQSLSFSITDDQQNMSEGSVDLF